MQQPIIYIDTSEINENRMTELKEAMKNLTSFVKPNVPRIMFYSFFLDEKEKVMSVVSIHPDSACLEYHMDKGNEEFRKFAEFIRLKKIEIYGEVSERVMERLRNKAEMLGAGTVSVFHSTSGFSRIAAV